MARTLQEVAVMKVLHERVAGIDVHKDMVKVAIGCQISEASTRKRYLRGGRWPRRHRS
jgi:hypothetical protein